MFTPNDNQENNEKRPEAGGGGYYYHTPRYGASENGNLSADRPPFPQPPLKSDESASAAPHQRGWADADYVRTGQVPAVSPHNYYSAGSPPRCQNGTERKKTHYGFGSAQIIALCLVCAIIGGSMGFFGAYIGGANSGGDLAEPTAAITGAVTPGVTQRPASGTTPLANGSPLSGSEIYALGCEQTVGISSEYTTTNVFGRTSSSAITGSGFIISEDGFVLTNYHVIEAAVYYGLDVMVMLYNGESYKAAIVGYEADNDVAVLKIDASGLPAVTIGNSDNMSVGDAVYAIGNPLGELAYSLTGGLVSALDREISTGSSNSYYPSSSTTINMFQIDAAVNSGNSGGPVYNDKGEVIGIVTAKYSSTGIEGLGFAIPINDAMKIASQLMEKGYVSGKASFGISVSRQYAGAVPGARVEAVNPGSCAETAGLQPGDVITNLDDYEITSFSDLLSAKKDYSAGDTVTLTVYRDGQTIKLELTFDEELPSTAAG